MTPMQALQDIARLAQQGRLDQAQSQCRALLKKSPGSVDAHRLLGMILSQQGQFAEAVEHLKLLAQAGVRDANALQDLADALTASGQFAEALEYYGQAVALAPERAELYFNLGFVMQRMGLHAQSVESYNKAITLRPNWSDAFNNLGLSLMELDRPEEAATRFDQALTLAPGHLFAMNNRGLALAELGRFDEAIAAYQHALNAKQDYFEVRSNLGASLLELRRYNDALGEFQRSLATNSSFGKAALNEALALLSLGNLPDGFQKYESRWRLPGVFDRRPQFTCPQWLGEENIEGKSIYVYAEQRASDTLQFCRYLPLLAAKGAHVTLEAPANLAGLLGTLPGQISLVTPGGETRGYDFHSPLCSLPLAFKTSLATIPGNAAYLGLPAGSENAFGDLQKTGGTLNIGICWKSGSPNRQLKKRNMPLATLLAMANNSPRPLRLFSLQMTTTAEEQQLLAASGGVANLGVRFTDYSDTAAAASRMDLVISVDTSVAHLCGAMGIPVWVALKYSPDWRWLNADEQNRWYPSAKQFVQKSIDDWDGVIGEMARALPRFQGK